MRIWLIGGGGEAATALRQLQKHPALDLVVSAPSADVRLVRDGLIERVDHVETVTSINVNQLAQRTRPDLILLALDPSDQGFGRIAGAIAFAEAMNYEIAAVSDYPCLVLE